MSSRILDDLNSMELINQPELDDYSIALSNSHDQGTISYMISLIEEALAIADASRFAAVGIDLSSALERLKAIEAEMPVIPPSQQE